MSRPGAGMIVGPTGTVARGSAVAGTAVAAGVAAGRTDSDAGTPVAPYGTAVSAAGAGADDASRAGTTGAGF